MNYSEQLKSPLWQKKRLKIMERDDFSCKVCGCKDKQLNVHHFKYKNSVMAWEYPDSVLITLCEKCHEFAHKIDDIFNVPFVRFTPEGMKNLYFGDDYIRDFGLSILDNHKTITSFMYDYIEHGSVVFESLSGNRFYVLSDLIFDKENELVWINSFFDAK